ncbi:hypothetical protein F5146DRAFT_21545 [Armillaria mellea]|nr:hypothetical protein F5146DRAFT_21545 [Armillaria mellea]
MFPQPHALLALALFFRPFFVSQTEAKSLTPSGNQYYCCQASWTVSFFFLFSGLRMTDDRAFRMTKKFSDKNACSILVKQSMSYAVAVLPRYVPYHFMLYASLMSTSKNNTVTSCTPYDPTSPCQQ